MKSSCLVVLSSLAIFGCTKRQMESAVVRTSSSIAKEYGFTLSARGPRAQPFAISLPGDFVATETVTKGTKKSRMIIAVPDGRRFLIHFSDAAAAWEKSIPGIDKALRTFAFSK